MWFLFWWYSQINSIYFGFLQFCAIPIGNTANQIALYCCSSMKQMCHISIKEIKHSAKFDKNVHFNQTAFKRKKTRIIRNSKIILNVCDLLGFFFVIYDNFKLCGRLESIYLYLFLESVFTQSHPIQLKLFPRLITH